MTRSKLSPATIEQAALYSVCHAKQPHYLYNEQVIINIEGRLRLESLNRFLSLLVTQHEALRTNFFVDDGGQICQRINAPFEVVVDQVAVGGANMSALELSTAVRVLALELGQKPYDLGTSPLMRVVLVQLPSDKQQLWFFWHHIIIDGGSINIMLREWQRYDTSIQRGIIPQLTTPEWQQSDYARWERDYLAGNESSKCKMYWRDYLKNMPPPLALPYDHSPPPDAPLLAERVSLRVDDDLLAGINLVRKQLDIGTGTALSVSVNTVILGALFIVLMHYTRQKDIVIGSPRANRRPELKNTMGYFVTMFALRADLSDDKKTIAALLAEIRETIDQSVKQYPLPHMTQNEIARENGWPQGVPLCEVALEYGGMSFKPIDIAGARLTGLGFDTMKDAKNKILLSLAARDKHLQGHIEYNTNYFEHDTIEQIRAHLLNVLAAFVDNPYQSIATVPLLSVDEQRHMLRGGANYAAPVVTDCIHHKFIHQAKQSPNAIAITCDGKELTYKALDNASNQLARHLIALGLKSKQSVAVYLNRSVDVVISFLAVLKAGCHYVPIDPTNPPERVISILKDCGTEFLLTHSNLFIRLDNLDTANCLQLDKEWKYIFSLNADPLDISVTPQDLAYIIYTSGTTGKPKGAQISHSNVVRLFTESESLFQFSSDDIWTVFHSFAFDFTTWELWGALFYGGKAIIVPYKLSREPERFCELVYKEGVTVLSQTPTAFGQFIAADKSLNLSADSLGLRYVVFGGEALNLLTLQPWFERHGEEHTKLINMFGITETCVHVTYRPITAAMLQDTRSLIGVTLPDLYAYVLNDCGQPVPYGVPGELFVGGAGVGQGYLNRRELTAEKFIDDPFYPAAGKLYRTGDLACWLRSDELEYLGRIDNQVNLHGFRIELNEVAAKILKHSAIQTCEVIETGESGTKQLAAYIVPDSDYIQADSQRAAISALKNYRQAFNATYAANRKNRFAGWTSALDRVQIPDAQMASWVDDTVKRILELCEGNDHIGIIEIGAGKGLLLLSLLEKLGQRCVSYAASDLSTEALAYIKTDVLPQLGGLADRVTLIEAAAHDISKLPKHDADLVIANSLFQYLPDYQNALSVMDGIGELLKHDGVVFVGDIRNKDTNHALAALIVRHNNAEAGYLPVSDVRHLIDKGLNDESELVLSPDFFRAYVAQRNGYNYVRVLPKVNQYDNELTNYRFDVYLYKRQPNIQGNIKWNQWSTCCYTLMDIETYLRGRKPVYFGIAGIPNANLSTDLRCLSLLELKGNDTLAEINAALDAEEISGLNLFELAELAILTDYRCYLNLTCGDKCGAVDVLFIRDNTTLPHFPGSSSKNYIALDFQDCANNPRLPEVLRGLVSELRDSLESQLPPYMIPRHIIPITALPLTSNGKVDKAALPPPRLVTVITDDYVAPVNETEKTLVQVWAQVLGLDTKLVGTHSSFINLGGDSILGVQVASIARQHGLYFLSVDLDRQKTIAKLAKVAGTESKIMAEQGQVTGAVPLTPVYHWFYNQQLANAHHYNQAWLFDVPALDKKILNAAVDMLLIHHDMLRLRVKKVGDSYRQEIFMWESDNLVCEVDISHVPENKLSEKIESKCSTFQSHLNIETGPLIRLLLIKLSKGKQKLLIVVHHLAVDGVSWYALLSDLATAYQQLSAGQSVKLPDKTTSFKTWSEKLLTYANTDKLDDELDYWRKFSEATYRLPVDKKRLASENILSRALLHSVFLEYDLTNSLLVDVHDAYNTKINDLLLTALSLACRQWTGNDKLLLTLEGHGREQLFNDVDISRTLGWFTTMFPVLISLPVADDLGQAIMSVKEQLRSIPKNGIGYGLLRYCNDDNPLSDIKTDLRFNYLGQLDRAVGDGEFFSWAKESQGDCRSKAQVRTLLIDINAWIMHGRLVFHIEYNSCNHHDSTIEKLGKDLVNVLRKLVEHCLSPDSGAYTPSDFDAELTQTELDQIVDELQSGGETA